MSKRLHGALINARYSTDNQNPDSIEVQVEKCTEWCHQNSIPVLGVYADEATSGMRDTRPRYAAMMRDLEAGVGDTVVIYDQSRMFRKMTAWFSFRDRMAALGVRVVSVTQPMIGKDLRDPTNFLTEGSMAMFSQIWALQTRQKVLEKMRHMAKNGLHTGGKPALGYRVEDGREVIDEAEAKIVRRIFAELDAGRSYREIAAGLRADGLKTKRGNDFGANSLHDLSKNERYVGVLVYGQRPYREDGSRNSHAVAEDYIRVEGAVPAIIDRELFDRVQRRHAANKRQQGGRPPTKRDYPLKGKVFCADCKAAMTISTSQKIYDYYVCTRKKRLHDCDGCNIPVHTLEQEVVRAVRQVLGTPANTERLIQILREQRGQIQERALLTLERLEGREREINQKLDNAINAVLAGLSSPAFQAKIEQLEREKADIAQERASIKATADASEIPESRLRQILADISTGDTPDGTAALLSIVARVEVGADTITIWTILDTDPDGAYDWEAEGLLITPGTPSGVPIVFVTARYLRMVTSKRDTS